MWFNITEIAYMISENIIALINSINFIDPSDLNFEIIVNSKICFGDILNFSMIYSVIDNKSKNIKRFNLDRSTISDGDNSFLQLIEDLNALVYQNTTDGKILPFKIEFPDFGQRLKISMGREFDLRPVVLRSNINYHTTKLQEEKIGTRVDNIKSYKFNTVGIIPLERNNIILILGFYLNVDQNQLISKIIKDRFFTKMENTLTKSHEMINQFKNVYLSEKDSSAFAYIIQLYKRMIWHEGIENIHFFTFNAYDRRLYYNYVDSGINKNDIQNYVNQCKDKLNLELTKAQKKYIKNKLDKILTEAEYNYAIKILDNLHKPEWINNEFLNTDGISGEFVENKKWILRKVFTCIPQEPWTGVAGYTASTRVMDISYSKKDKMEERWISKFLEDAYFYRKLMTFEILLGVGGEGAMAAFPILDCGQIGGVLFANRRKGESLHFDPETLRQLFNLSIFLKSLIQYKRMTDYIFNVLNSLITDTWKQIEPFAAIIQHLPDLLNPALVIVWNVNYLSRNKIHIPQYIFMYKGQEDYVFDEANISMIPLSYQKCEEDEKNQLGFSINHYKYIKMLNCKSKRIILNQDDVYKSLPEKLYYIHEKQSDSGVSKPNATLTRHRLKSGILLEYKKEEMEGYIVIYTLESENILKDNEDSILQKIKIIHQLIHIEDIVYQIISGKLSSLHEAKYLGLNPLDGFLGEVLSKIDNLFVKLKNINNSQHLQEVRSLIQHTINVNVSVIKDIFAELDELIAKEIDSSPQKMNLVKLVKEIIDYMPIYWKFRVEIVSYQKYLKINCFKLIVSLL